jgi:hypothetical protein
VYRKLAQVMDKASLEKLTKEVRDWFGPRFLPGQVPWVAV